ncbi:peptide ABC transporter ATP-binding protein [Aestuariivirga litoralis]|uniref:Peptide ABC transporter ATP-binding protein n=1 Tax=Aestuariivirga litoralis TaxID=2650924 RepID=A0A2W2B935_9HYPH|nr:ABC transporter ATP-binding protein [Aestuariivirga litoralis]PZF76804.1 peptide ABC transporter ATP-binding protein [Aestuariivirga litoralis]
MAEPLLTTTGLTRRFTSGGGLLRRPRSMTAVRDVTLAIPRGSVTGVVGESGCGKSTLARLVLRLIEPSQGRVGFDGADLTALPAGELRRMRRRMQMVFQDPYSSLDPRYTIAEVLAEPFRVQGERVSRDAIDHLLSQVGLAAPMAAAYPHQLSGGQRQRVGVARALALKPDFVVLDEPTASLDVSIQAQIVALLERLKSELGLTYMFISHDLGLVRYFCDRILVMYLGAVVEELPSTEAAPRHPYTRALLDSTFSPDPALRRRLVALKGEIPSPFDLPRGCAFAGRCPHATAHCRDQRPELAGEAGGHRVACFHPL